MKLCTKFVVLLITVLSLHHYCEWNQCSGDLKQFCTYTSPSTWNVLLAERNELYGQKIAPKFVIAQAYYSKFVQPYVHEVSKNVNQYVTKPVSQIVAPKLAAIEGKPYVVFVHNQLSFVCQKVHTYYAIFVEPYVMQVEKKLGLCKQVSPLMQKMQPLCDATAPYIKCAKSKFEEMKSRYLTYIKEAQLSVEEAKKSAKKSVEGAKKSVQEAKESLAKKVSAAKVKKSKTVVPPASTVSTSKDRKMTPALDKEVYEELYHYGEDLELDGQEEEDEGEDEEQITSTSTVIKVVTLSEGENAPVPHDTEVSDSVAIDEQTALQIDFDNWADTIEKKVDSIGHLFEKEANRTMKNILKAKNTTVKAKLKDVTSVTQKKFQEISKNIEDIDSIEEIDQKTGEKVYFDKTGTTQLPAFVDRASIRDLFDAAQNAGLIVMSEINSDIGDLNNEIFREVEKLREEYADVYEEWANVMVNEWSKRLAYVDVLDAHSDDASVSEENWKKFMKIKNEIIEKRDDILTHSIVTDDLLRFTNKVQNTLLMINRENGEFAYILRSKANLAFQKREKESANRQAEQADAQKAN